MSEMIKFDKSFNVITSDYTHDDALNVPIKLWLSQVEKGALQQMYKVARLPFIFKHLAVMPDAHVGYGMPIGGVLATEQAYVIPNAIGVDISCGICVLRTDRTHIKLRTLLKIRDDIRKLVPVSYKHHKTPQPGMPEWTGKSLNGTIINGQYDSARRQLGTLGGGNHFIEIQLGDDGYIYIMIHSGSRNLGKQVADHYNNIAIEYNEKWFSQVPKKWQLAFLPTMDSVGRQYMNEMEYCVRFAAANRMLMMERVKEAMNNHVDATFYDGDYIDVAHNFARIENHFNKNVLVHRKGATPAYIGQLGIIPGSQGTSSYIVRGLGNKESFMSCSHGSGRTMGRKEAQKKLDLEAEIKKLDDKGIIHNIRKQKDLDEASGAYKNIYEVMAHQSNLVEPIVELKPLAVVKG